MTSCCNEVGTVGGIKRFTRSAPVLTVSVLNTFSVPATTHFFSVILLKTFIVPFAIKSGHWSSLKICFLGDFLVDRIFEKARLWILFVETLYVQVLRSLSIESSFF